MKLALLCACSTLAILASICAVPFPAAIAAASGVLAFAIAKRARDDSGWELLAFVPFLPLIFFFVTTPGADAAMYAAQARALLDGSREISAAYPGVRSAMYPRGFPSLIALFVPFAGMAKASLCAAVCAYAAFTLALATWLRRFVDRIPALGAAIAIVCISRHTPIGAFSWGGNSGVLACALAIFALCTEDAIAASLLLGGAFATHPIGAIAGLACLPFIARSWRALIPCLTVAPLLVCFKQLGPEISPAEAAWVVNWQATQAQLVHEATQIYALNYLSAFSRECGDLFAVAVYLSCFSALWFRENVRAAGMALGGLIYIGLLMRFGPRLPAIGTFIYADRLPPMWLLVCAPILVLTAAKLPRPLALASCLAIGVFAHWHVKLGEPLLTRDELAIAPCVAAQVPKGEPIVASYGQGGQWFPALIDRAITQAHAHVTLFDEISAQRKEMRSQYQFLNAGKAIYGPLIAPLPAAEVLCEVGSAKLVRLQTRVEAGSDGWQPASELH